MAFFAYCMAASAIYCFNDIYDVEADKQHPEKSKRPIASGAVSCGQAYFLMFCCIAISYAILYFSDFSVSNGMLPLMGIIALYLIMNIAYCVRLKHIAIIDVFIIAVGFVLRVLVGGFSTNSYLSHWIILITFLLALFLAFAKRRDDVVKYEELGIKMRPNINRYNVKFMDQIISVIASILMMCYIMYTVSPDITTRFNSDNVYLTIVFVFIGLARYLQITVVDAKSGSPTKVLLHDRFIQSSIAGWIISFCILLYA